MNRLDLILRLQEVIEIHILTEIKENSHLGVALLSQLILLSNIK